VLVCVCVRYLEICIIGCALAPCSPSLPPSLPSLVRSLARSVFSFLSFLLFFFYPSVSLSLSLYISFSIYLSLSRCVRASPLQAARTAAGAEPRYQSPFLLCRQRQHVSQQVTRVCVCMRSCVVRACVVNSICEIAHHNPNRIAYNRIYMSMGAESHEQGCTNYTLL
jgi:hypothetical protein